MRTLVIDDEPFVLKLLARQLKNLGFEEVVLHECGHDALTMLENQAETIGLIFCDLQMPQMDGVEFVRHLVRIGYTGSLVLVSGEADRVLQSAEKLARAHQLRVLGVLQACFARAAATVAERETVLFDRRGWQKLRARRNTARHRAWGTGKPLPAQGGPRFWLDCRG